MMCVQTDVFIAMELMGTCAEKLKKRIQGPMPERILGKMTVAVSGKTHTLPRRCNIHTMCFNFTIQVFSNTEKHRTTFFI